MVTVGETEPPEAEERKPVLALQIWEVAPGQVAVRVEEAGGVIVVGEALRVHVGPGQGSVRGPDMVSE